jgi:hypothetical protein
MVKWLRVLAIPALALFSAAEPALAANDFGKVTGLVADLAGTPQMGAIISLSPETSSARATQLLTDQNGIFVGQRLRPGFYSLKATLPGFLPSIQHITVTANLTTLVRIELDSVFSSLDHLRRQPAQPTESDDWKWVLRASSSSRPVLQFRDATVVIAEAPSADVDSHRAQPRTRVEMTSGSSQPGSSSGMPSGVLGTAVSYDQSLGGAGKLLLAGEVNYDQQIPGGVVGSALATTWVPGSDLGRGPETTLVMRQIRYGSNGRSIRSMRFGQTEEAAIGRLTIHYGAEYLMAGPTGLMASAIRPHAEIAAQVSRYWTAQVLLETDADSYGLATRAHDLEGAIDALQNVPVLISTGQRPVLAGGWHQEFSMRREIGSRGTVENAVFHDMSHHQAVYGLTTADAFSRPRAFDGGADSSWGTRIAYTERLTRTLDLGAIYTWAGALAPDGAVEPLSGLSGMLRTRYRHSVATRLSGKLPLVRTRLAASYKWVNGTAVSRQDLFGEAAKGVDPYLSLSIRQPLPSFLTAGHWEALADFRNMLSQGYASLESQDGRILLMPVDRSFRGGLSFQF